jgi:hypothetical protein
MAAAAKARTFLEILKALGGRAGTVEKKRS